MELFGLKWNYLDKIVYLSKEVSWWLTLEDSIKWLLRGLLFNLSDEVVDKWSYDISEAALSMFLKNEEEFQIKIHDNMYVRKGKACK